MRVTHIVPPIKQTGWRYLTFIITSEEGKYEVRYKDDEEILFENFVFARVLPIEERLRRLVDKHFIFPLKPSPIFKSDDCYVVCDPKGQILICDNHGYSKKVCHINDLAMQSHQQKIAHDY